MKRLRSILHVIDTINNWVGKITSYILIFLIFSMCYEVVLRYGFNRPTLWSFDTVVILFGIYSILGGGYTLFREAHVTMDLFYSRLSNRWKCILDLISSVFFFSFCFILLWYGGEDAWNSFKLKEVSTTPFKFPLYPLKIAVPVGAILILAQGLAKFLRDFITAVTGKDGNL